MSHRKSKWPLLALALLSFSSAEAACLERLDHPGRIVVQSCEVIDTVKHPYVGVVARRLAVDKESQRNFLEKFTGVIISTADEKFFYRDPSQSACESIEAGDVLQAEVKRECCDGGGGAPCGLGFDTYITAYQKE